MLTSISVRLIEEASKVSQDTLTLIQISALRSCDICMKYFLRRKDIGIISFIKGVLGFLITYFSGIYWLCCGSSKAGILCVKFGVG